MRCGVIIIVQSMLDCNNSTHRMYTHVCVKYTHTHTHTHTHMSLQLPPKRKGEAKWAKHCPHRWLICLADPYQKTSNWALWTSWATPDPNKELSHFSASNRQQWCLGKTVTGSSLTEQEATDVGCIPSPQAGPPQTYKPLTHTFTTARDQPTTSITIPDTLCQTKQAQVRGV